MRKISMERHRPRVLILMALLSVLGGGCGEKQQQAEIISLEGKIEKIERTSDTKGKITVVFFSEKQKQEMTGTAEVTKETEIMIDGAAAILKDLHDGDQLRGEVRVEKKGDKKVQSVLKIKVERPKSGASGG
jgi:hypothetical protein